MSESKLFSLFQDHNQCLEEGLALCADVLDPLAATLAESFAQGQRLLIIGSGMMSPIAAAVAQAFAYQLNTERPPLPVVCVEPGAGVRSALAATEDYGQLYSGALQAVAREDDQLLIFDGTSDEAVTGAARTARDLDCAVTVFCAADSARWANIETDSLVILPDAAPGRRAELLLFLGHVLCQMVEGELFGL
nr:SIS domain-containing protein [uncultured Desulfuromonas sp.]